MALKGGARCIPSVRRIRGRSLPTHLPRFRPLRAGCDRLVLAPLCTLRSDLLRRHVHCVDARVRPRMYLLELYVAATRHCAGALVVAFVGVIYLLLLGWVHACRMRKRLSWTPRFPMCRIIDL